MNSPTLTLVSHALCPYVQRVAIALTEKGLPFERITIDLADKPAWFTALSPTGKVPLLRVARPDGSEAVLFESSVICEYIEETAAGPALHPTDPLERAQHRAWMEYGSAILADLWGLETARDRTAYDQRRQALAWKFARVEAALDSAGPYFAGDRFCLVDAVFGPVFRYFDVFDTLTDTGVFDGLGKAQAWRRALAARPSVRDAAAPDYAGRLLRFLEEHDAFLLTRPGRAA
ncbi:glutathione S-transferase family protein [Aquabacterium sp. A7-Y]|uniref:glutathione S-transferase family protein n=1 Tax=Aquabacterium sp. A7-Y TaxID=1349605 RepID=UPI00223CCE63|nr:glutathione S-transferase family protein [Aquabacterium sp. A7-Y]MCW7538812.1 glutathione S-transferase family protein [Aquabacterium sp. A7-Y]